MWQDDCGPRDGVQFRFHLHCDGTEKRVQLASLTFVCTAPPSIGAHKSGRTFELVDLLRAVDLSWHHSLMCIQEPYTDTSVVRGKQVIKLREHELRWAESTASEMSLRSELCALKDENAAAVSETAILKRRCDALQRENNDLGERYA